MPWWQNGLLMLAAFVIFAIRLSPLGRAAERAVGRGLGAESGTWTAEAWWADVRRGAPARLGGLWFGLVDLDPGGWHISVAGTARFDPEDESGAWRAGPFPWRPADPYLSFPEAGELDAEDAAARAADLVRGFAPWHDVAVEGVAAGFDDGPIKVVYRAP
jgi:hypothetical protein